MSRILFENSKFALGFAAVTIVGAGLLMGTDNSVSGVELEEESQPAPSQQVAGNSAPDAPQAPPQPQPVIADWASDEELIDSAQGFDPTPEETAEIIDNSAPGAGNTGSSNQRSSGSAAPTPNVANRPGPAPATPKTARRSRALDVK
ncbi:MAG: hypothetical protein AAGE86_01055 [Pseudomonadota bacterium]